MELFLKIFDGKDVTESILDSSKSNVFVRSFDTGYLSLFDSTGNEILHVDFLKS